LFYHCTFVQNRPTRVCQTFLRAALNPIGHTACSMSYRVDTQLCLWHTWRRKKQLLSSDTGLSNGCALSGQN
jgi:hypothetical protein